MDSSAQIGETLFPILLDQHGDGYICFFALIHPYAMFLRKQCFRMQRTQSNTFTVGFQNKRIAGDEM